MNPQPHKARQRPSYILSAAMLWLTAVLSLAAGVQQVVPLDLGQSRQVSSDAARAGDLPAQRSTAANLQARLALLSERSLEALPASGFDGPETAVLPTFGFDLPLYAAARGDSPHPAITLPAYAAGFRARAPPILA